VYVCVNVMIRKQKEERMEKKAEEL
jgi:hypothetical protein